MAIHARQGGVWRDIDPLSVKQGGVWRLVENGFARQGGVWSEIYSAYTPAVAWDGFCTGGADASYRVEFLGAWSSWFSCPWRTLVYPDVATPMQYIRNDGQDGSVQVVLTLQQDWASGGPDTEGDSWGVESTWRRPCSAFTDTDPAGTASDDGIQQTSNSPSGVCRTYDIDAGCDVRAHQIVRSYYRDSGTSSNLNIRFRTRILMKTIDPYDDWTKI